MRFKEHQRETAKRFRVARYSDNKFYVERFFNGEWDDSWGYGMKDKHEAFALLHRTIKYASPEEPVRLEVVKQY